MSVANVGYYTSGGPNNNRHLHVEVSLVDDNAAAVAGAEVIAEVYHSATLDPEDFILYTTRSETSDSDGVFDFRINNAPSGLWTTIVIAVEADGLEWDGETPENQFIK